MSTITNMKCLICLFICIYSALSTDINVERNVDIRPGGQTITEEIVWKDLKCSFTYQAQGGTKEKWIFDIIPDAAVDNKLTCVIYRPESTTSYLFFQSFTFKVEGAQILDSEIIGLKHEKLPDVEQVRNKKENIVKNSDNFRNGMTKIKVHVLVGKDKVEL